MTTQTVYTTQTILVVEDSRDLLEDVIEMLELEGYEAYGAADGVEGVEAAKELLPDLIVCDIMMPELDGYGVLMELREDPRTAMIPFIFLTAKTEREDMRHGMNLGADDFLTKPFLVSELLDSIESRLRIRNKFDEAANERLEKLRKNIITALPHELRTPLNTIIGFSDMLVMEAQELKPDQIADWATHVNSAAHRLYRLVENYLYYVRLQTAVRMHDKRLERSSETTHEFRSIIETEAIKVAHRHERPDDLQLEISDAPVLRLSYTDGVKIVGELVDNAFKFSEAGDTVTLRGKPTDEGYCLEVIDEGRGMTKEQADNIGAYMQFERWLYEQQGMGLGLAIVKLLMEIYNGQFGLEGTLDEGTRVTVCLESP
jgi:DNA-binding response OmpR family regulator/two-component sensor histidine kinase